MAYGIIFNQLDEFMHIVLHMIVLFMHLQGPYFKVG